MSCLGPFYNPKPTREWSRVENACTYQNPTVDGSQQTFIPLLNKTVPNYQVAAYLQLLAKGNVLQYKKNSADLTRNQRFSLIAQNKWTNRTTTYATQSEIFSNPNNQSLVRAGTFGNITADGVPTLRPPTRPKVHVAPIYPVVPGYIAGGAPNGNPVVPPPPAPGPPATTIVPPATPPTPPETVVFQDGGVLVCNQTEDPVTGVIITKPYAPNVHPTTDSDVPGKTEYLYWDDTIQSWYPRQRYTMNNSTDKWPYNSKTIVPAGGFNPPPSL